MKTKIIAMLIILILPLFAGSQENIEDILEEAEDEIEASDLLETLDYLRNNPLNLNNASIEDLQTLPWLSPQTAAQIVDYRNQNGEYDSIDELKIVVDDETLEQIRPYLNIETMPTEIHFNVRSRLIDRPYETDGFYQRSQFYNRFRIEYGDKYAAGALVEKDAKEDVFTDFYSWYVQINDFYFVKKAIVGYYKLTFGQGLLFAPYSGIAKSTSLNSLKKTGLGLRPYTSSNEVFGFRGIVLGTAWKNLESSLYFSSENLDATLSDDGKSVISIYETGYHRTDVEKEKKDKLKEELIGVNLKYTFGNLILETTAYHSQFSLPIAPEIERDRFYAFRGDTQQMWSFSFDYYRDNLNYFGEFAQDLDNGNGAVLGVIGESGKLKWAAIGRRYEKDFYSLHGNSFGENSDELRNEQGLYLGWKYKLDSETKIAGYIDVWRNPWRRYLEDMPVEGTEAVFQVKRELFHKCDLTVRLKEKSKEKYKSVYYEDGTQETSVFWQSKKNYRVQIDVEASKKVSLRLRMEQNVEDLEEVAFSQSSELVYAGVDYSPFSSTQLYAQITTFGDIQDSDIESSALPIYVYEKDLLGIPRNTALYGRGMKWFVRLKQDIWNDLEITLKYENTISDEMTTDQIRVQFDGEF